MKNLFNKIFGGSNEKNSSSENASNSKNTTEPPKLKFLNSDYEITEEWLDLFTHFILLDKYNEMPAKSWYEETESIVSKIGVEEFISIGSKWINDCIEKSKENQRRYAKLGTLAANEQIQKDLGFDNRSVPEWVKIIYGDNITKEGFIRLKSYAYLDNYQNYFYQSLGGRILRGFVHSSVLNKDQRLLELVDKLALSNPNTSQDPIHVYCMLPEEISIPKLTILKAKAKNKNILKRIDKAITILGKKSGKTKAEIEESVVPDLGINRESKLNVLSY